MDKQPIFFADTYCEEGENITKVGVQPNTQSLWRSYFEALGQGGALGNQWVFVYNWETHILNLHCRDLGWDKAILPARLRLSDLSQALQQVKQQTWMEAMHYIATGKVLNPIPVSPPLPSRSSLVDCYITVAITKDKDILTLSGGESVWLDACIEASGYKPPTWSERTVLDVIQRMNKTKED